MIKTLTRKIVLPIALIVVLLFIAYSIVLPTTSRAIATSHLRTVSNQELQPLLQPVNAIMQGVRPKGILRCSEESHTRTKTYAFCEGVKEYKYIDTPVPDSSRPAVIAEAAALDKVLAQNGWIIDRPQDQAKTVVASIPATPLQPSHAGGVPFHKNVGNISCNFEVDFGGPTDGISPGLIKINKFSCQEYVTYFMLHASEHANSFGG